MASHLTVTTAANPGVSVKGLNAQASAEAPQDAFAALLGDTTPVDVTDQPAKAAPTAVALAADGLIDLVLDADGNPADAPDLTPDAVAVPVDAVAPIQQPISPQALLTGIIDSLTALRAAAQNGQMPSADDLAKLNKDLAALAGQLGLSLDKLPSMDDLAAMAIQPLSADSTVEAQLISTLAPLTQSVLTDATAPTTDAATANQLQAIGQKLAALLQGLNDGAVDVDAMAGIGDDKAPIDPELQAALDRLLKPAASTIAAATNPQVFTPPKLTVSEAMLASKTADAPGAAAAKPADDASTTPTSIATSSAVAKADATADGSTNTQDHHDKPKDSKIDAVVTAAAKTVDKAAETMTPAQAGVHTATRIEATPGPRPVISGYQTSQQQLNLPQMAFELVRQVNDGNTRFQMRLDPPELGKIDVRVDIDRTGQVTARLTVEKAETLDLMQRDQRGLEKALQQAGLDGSKTNLEFSLKQNPFSGSQQGQDQGGRQSLFGDSVVEADETPAPQVNLYRASLSASGVNIIA